MKMISTQSPQRQIVTTLRTLCLASLGSALEFYDFIIFVFFTRVIADLFFPASVPDWLRQVETFGIFAAGYLARPIGGIVLAHFGDTRAQADVYFERALDGYSNLVDRFSTHVPINWCRRPSAAAGDARIAGDRYWR